MEFEDRSTGGAGEISLDISGPMGWDLRAMKQVCDALNTVPDGHPVLLADQVYPFVLFLNNTHLAKTARTVSISELHGALEILGAQAAAVVSSHTAGAVLALVQAGFKLPDE